MKKNIIQINNQNGVILVMSMLILSVMMTSVFALSRIIMGEINMTRNIDNSIIAFYVAESGIEKSLYYIKNSQEVEDFYHFSMLDGTEHQFRDDNERKITIIEASTEADYFQTYNMLKNNPTHVAIIDPSGDVSDVIHHRNKYKIFWEVDNCEVSGNAKLEITLESFKNNFTYSDTKKHIAICGSCWNGDFCTSGGSDGFEGNIEKTKYYNFSFEALTHDIKYLHFMAWDSNNEEEGIWSEISIKTEGKYRNSTQHLQARLPALGSVSDIFSYVIFSGGDLGKLNNE